MFRLKVKSCLLVSAFFSWKYESAWSLFSEQKFFSFDCAMIPIRKILQTETNFVFFSVFWEGCKIVVG